jgi:division protein CdvB (Snf7/Vps24/ESCRT-III family)
MQTTRKRIKTAEEIMKANLNKTLRLLKHKVADREELWLEFFQDATNAMLGAYADASAESIRDVVKDAREIADWMMNEYEDRWGKA